MLWTMEVDFYPQKGVGGCGNDGGQGNPCHRGSTPDKSYQTSHTAHITTTTAFWKETGGILISSGCEKVPVNLL